MTGYLVLAAFLLFCWLAWPRPTDRRRTGPCGCTCRYCKTRSCQR